MGPPHLLATNGAEISQRHPQVRAGSTKPGPGPHRGVWQGGSIHASPLGVIKCGLISRVKRLLSTTTRREQREAHAHQKKSKAACLTLCWRLETSPSTLAQTGRPTWSAATCCPRSYRPHLGGVLSLRPPSRRPPCRASQVSDSPRSSWSTAGLRSCSQQVPPPDVAGLDARDYRALVAPVAITTVSAHSHWHLPRPSSAVESGQSKPFILIADQPRAPTLPRSQSPHPHPHPWDLNARDTDTFLAESPSFPPFTLRTQIARSVRPRLGGPVSSRESHLIRSGWVGC